MPEQQGHELTLLLKAWSEGDKQALEKLTPSVYRELHRLAKLYMARERPNHPLQATALINEAYVRLIDWKDVRWQSRTHFFAMAAKLMRRVLVDIARSRKQGKRGGGAMDTTFNEALVIQPAKSRDMIALDEATHPARRNGPTEKSGCGTAVLRRVERRRNSPCAPAFRADRAARMELCPGLAST